MKALFYVDGEEVLGIPLEELTTENRLWWIDTLSECFGVDANSIEVKIKR